MRDRLYEIENSEQAENIGALRDQNLDDDNFLSRVEYEDEITEAEQARRDFLLIEREQDDLKELLTELKSKSKEYLNIFLCLAGKDKPPENRNAKQKNMKKWPNHPRRSN